MDDIKVQPNPDTQIYDNANVWRNNETKLKPFKIKIPRSQRHNTLTRLANE